MGAGYGADLEGVKGHGARIVRRPAGREGRPILARCFQLDPGVEVLVRTHGDVEPRFLEDMDAARALLGEREPRRQPRP